MIKKLNLSLFFYWLLVIAVFAFILFYLFKHDAYFFSDILWHYDASLNLLHGWSHQDYQEMVVPAYLLNVPFVLMGLGFYGLKVVCFLFEITAFVCFLWSFDSRVLKSYLLPLCLILFLSIYSMWLQSLFDYYSVPVIFLLFALAAYLKVLQGYKPALFSVLSALSFVVMACTSIAMLPIVSFLLALLLLIRRSRHEVLIAALFAVCISLLLWLYIGVLGEGALYQYAFLHHRINTITSLFFATCFALFVTILLAIAIPYLIYDSFTGKALKITLIAWFAVTFLTLSTWGIFEYFYKFGTINAFFNVSFAVSAVFSLFLLCYRKLSVAKRYQLFWVSFALIVVLALHRGTSGSGNIIYLYFPALLSIHLCVVDQFWKSAWKPWVFALLLVVFMSFPIYSMTHILRTHHQSLISINQQDFHGLPETTPLMNVQRKMLKTYKENSCDQKPFLALFDYVSAYIVTNRLPLFHRSFIPFYTFEWRSRQVESKPLIQYFSKLNHWCVAFKTSPWDRIGVRRQGIFKQWLIEHSTKHIAIGVLPDRHEFVWLFAK